MTSLPTALDTVKEKLLSAGNNLPSSKMKMNGNNAALNPKASFLNPKIFPLRSKAAEDGPASVTPSYCELLNFDPQLYRLPSAMSMEDRSNRLDLGEDGRVVKYSGPGRTDSDAAAVRANSPLPPQIGIYYFEVTIVSKGREGYISVGFAIKSASLSRLCGWEPGTIGYHADDGNLYRGAGTGAAFGPSYTTGDIVGCGVNFHEKSFFFTKNGVLVGEVTNLKDKFHLPFFPCVGCRTPGEVLSCNFGNKSFAFDINAFVQRRLRSQLHSEELSSACQVQERLILSYLVHLGFQRTAQAFLNAISPAEEANQKREIFGAFEAAQTRRKIVEAIKNGNVSELGRLIGQYYPSFLMEHPEVAFRLECLSFVQLVVTLDRSNEALVKEMIECGHRLATGFPPEITSALSQQLGDVLALAAYKDPQSSPVAYLLDRPFRNSVASFVDEALLKYEGKDIVSPLHRLLQQTQAVMDELQYQEDPEVALVNV